jgi:type III secretory pathway component EscT
MLQTSVSKEVGMTGSEWYEMSLVAFANAVEAFAMIVTLASAYLFTAYTVGANLTRTQVILVNIVFVSAMLFFAIHMAGSMGDSMQGRTAAAELVPELGTAPRQIMSYYFGLGLTVVIGVFLICIKFMWDVRHRNRSDASTSDSIRRD